MPPPRGVRLVGSLSELAEVGVRFVRLQYADLHGICRGKLIPISAFPHVAEEGMGFVEAIMTVDLRHNVVAGFEGGFPDLLARPDLPTMVPLPWEEDVVACLVDLEDPVTHEPHPLDCRGVLKRVLGQFSEFGVSPVVGPELEFYLLEPDASSPRGFRPYAAQDSAVYTVGEMADPRGTLGRMLDAAVELELGAIAAAHEYGRSQFEINLRHSDALDSCDRAFRFRAMVKELAARDGLLATFMGKPFNDDEGSGFHLHVSLVDAEGVNAGEAAGRRPRSDPRDVPLHRRRDGARAGDDGVLQPDRERLPADQRRGARPDARVLGPRPPDDARAGPQGARVLDAARAPPRRRDREPVPRLRRRARGRASTGSAASSSSPNPSRG